MNEFKQALETCINRCKACQKSKTPDKIYNLGMLRGFEKALQMYINLESGDEK